MNQKGNNKNKKKNNNSSNSLVFGRWPQTKILTKFFLSKVLSRILISCDQVSQGNCEHRGFFLEVGSEKKLQETTFKDLVDLKRVFCT